MKWTTERPTAAGWYWMRWPNGDRHIVHLKPEPGIRDELLVWEIDTRGVVGVKSKYYDGCRWAGPIQEPEDER